VGPNASADKAVTLTPEDVREAQAVFDRKSGVLLELAAATPASLERLLKQHAGEMDQMLLEMLYSRMRAAKALGEARSPASLTHLPTITLSPSLSPSAG